MGEGGKVSRKTEKKEGKENVQGVRIGEKEAPASRTPEGSNDCFGQKRERRPAIGTNISELGGRANLVRHPFGPKEGIKGRNWQFGGAVKRRSAQRSRELNEFYYAKKISL